MHWLLIYFHLNSMSSCNPFPSQATLNNGVDPQSSTVTPNSVRFESRQKKSSCLDANLWEEAKLNLQSSARNPEPGINKCGGKKNRSKEKVLQESSRTTQRVLRIYHMMGDSFKCFSPRLTTWWRVELHDFRKTYNVIQFCDNELWYINSWVYSARVFLHWILLPSWHWTNWAGWAFSLLINFTKHLHALKRFSVT